MPLFNVMFTLTFIPPFKKSQRDAWAIWLWLGPWRNHYPHDPKLLIPSLTPPSVSHFSHSLDKFIYMKDHSYWHGPAGKWQSNQRFHAILPSPSYTHSPRAVVSVSLINLPLSHDWRDQHVLIILPWFELDQRSIQLHKHSTSERDKHPASALCIQKAEQGQGKTQSDSLFVFPSVWILPYWSCMVCLVEQKDRQCMPASPDLRVSDQPQQCRHQKTWLKNLFMLQWFKYFC